MGFWKTEKGINGDSWADKLEDCMDALSANKIAHTKTYGNIEHEITLAEFADLIMFCSMGHLIVDLRNIDEETWSLSKLHDIDVITYSNPGQNSLF